MTLPLVYGEEIIGACLLGRRDPDDRYGPAEGKLLRMLMHQTALALVNFDQSALLGALHRDSIQFRDRERTRLARDLHDEVLPQMALLTHHVGEPQAFEQAYQAAVERVRQVINGLSPATLEQFGLHTALEELLGDLDERIRGAGQESPSLAFSLSPEKLRYPGEVELHLFRIVQQACLNALKHAQACNLGIRGDLQAGKIELAVEDDGTGFDLSQGLDVASLVENRHYGLLTMCERAALIGAVLRIDASPGKGTLVRVSWRTGAGNSLGEIDRALTPWGESG
jgi:signal transduction histidine kinase